MTIAATPARPLRALWVGLTLWICGRAVFIWAEGAPMEVPVAGNAARERMVQPLAMTDTSFLSPHPILRFPPIASRGGILSTIEVVGPESIRAKVSPSRDIDPATPGPGSSAGRPLLEKVVVQTEAPTAIRTAGPVGRIALRPVSPLLSEFDASNWSGSFWLAARDGSGLGLAAGNGQLGGSQAGIRVYRRLTPALALTGRVSSAFAARQGEASLGVALRRGPFALLAERRIALDRGGRNDWSVTAAAGVSDLRLPFDLRLDGYAQAGIVGRDGFADGALRVERTVLGAANNRLSIGAGSWGSMQPGLARLDIGPQIVAHTALAGRPFRVAAEWRQRVAGNATPGSGPVITFGADF